MRVQLVWHTEDMERPMCLKTPLGESRGGAVIEKGTHGSRDWPVWREIPLNLV
jgi:hypothetical protein